MTPPTVDTCATPNPPSGATAREHVQVRLTGAGGQGLITAGIILAEAGLRDGRNVVQTQSYGPEARLGASKAEVIISSGPIAYPQVTVPDVLVCLSQDAAAKYLPHVHERTIVILDSTNIGALEARGVVHRLPITSAAIEAGNKVAANVVALWALNTIAGLVGPEHLREAILARLPQRFRELNERALAAGERIAAGAETASV